MNCSKCGGNCKAIHEVIVMDGKSSVWKQVLAMLALGFFKNKSENLSENQKNVVYICEKCGNKMRE